MKRLLKKIGNWFWRRLVRLFLFIKKVIFNTPVKLREWIFSFARWGKNQLDKRINSSQRLYLRTVIFENDTAQGRKFDTAIMWMIVLSVLAVIAETVTEFHSSYWWIFQVLEWIFTLIFTAEYVLRLYSAEKPLKYATSFFGIVDLLAILPTYLGIFFVGIGNLVMIRVLRLLRVFRIFKMGHFVKEGEVILSALRASKIKIYVFVSFVILISMILGSMLYIVEGDINPKLDNIPKGIYWAIVTLTTVGYGDVTPITPFGQFLATLIMIMGYGVIAVPTGIVTAEISGRVMNLKEVKFAECKSCGQGEHHTGAVFCHKCGEVLEDETPDG